jgi:maltose O-acetyltransferase
VEIGDFTLFSPAVQIYTATHPLNAGLRRKQEFAKPIQIGADVWSAAGPSFAPA